MPNRGRQSKALDLEAYIVPSNPYDNDPYYYRIGSPYQQIIDAETYERLQQPPQEENMNTRMMMEDNLRKRKEYKVVCHTTNWAFYRKGEGKFVPENLDFSLCTHVVYSFATLDPEQFIMLEFDPWADVENRLYSRTVKLANGKPVLLAIGGWTDSNGDKYSKMVASKKLRANFIDNVAPFLKRYGFSGLHVDWNYPACPQSDCKAGHAADKANFAQFVQELRRSLKQSDLMLSISVSGYKEIITEGYDFVAISKAVDFMTVMTYDYHGAWETVTGHVR
jgi:chitinase